jgi:hypothetical protein
MANNVSVGRTERPSSRGHSVFVYRKREKTSHDQVAEQIYGIPIIKSLLLTNAHVLHLMTLFTGTTIWFRLIEWSANNVLKRDSKRWQVWPDAKCWGMSLLSRP